MIVNRMPSAVDPNKAERAWLVDITGAVMTVYLDREHYAGRRTIYGSEDIEPDERGFEYPDKQGTIFLDERQAYQVAWSRTRAHMDYLEQQVEVGRMRLEILDLYLDDYRFEE